ncbi:MAG: hypothetical protein N2Z68_00415 [Patescibacteria group bacterium]|nr:hypothetical protein [Patescibacteria group bacterium]
MKNKEKDNLFSILKNCRGQMLAETMVALGMVTIGLLGLLALLSYSLALNKVVADQYIATYLATEGIEITKNILDNQIARGRGFGLGEGYFEADFNSSELFFLSKDKTQAQSSARSFYFDSVSKRYSYQAGSQSQTTPFRRIIRLQQLNNPEKIVVNSIVFWKTRNQGSFEINLEDHFFNWK